MNREFPFELVTPGGVVWSGNILRLTLRDEFGSLSILTGHAPLVAGLPEQTAELETAAGIQKFTVSGGVVEQSPAGATILTPKAALV